MKKLHVYKTGAPLGKWYCIFDSLKLISKYFQSNFDSIKILPGEQILVFQQFWKTSLNFKFHRVGLYVRACCIHCIHFQRVISSWTMRNCPFNYLFMCNSLGMIILACRYINKYSRNFASFFVKSGIGKIYCVISY